MTWILPEFDFLLASLHCLLYRYGNDLPVVTIALGLSRPQKSNETSDRSHKSCLSRCPRSPARPSATSQWTCVLACASSTGTASVPLNRAMAGLRRVCSLHAGGGVLSYLPVKRHIQLPRLDVHISRMPNSWVREPCGLLAHAEDSTLSVIIRYPSRALTRDDARRIAGHWRQVIEQVTANPDASMGALRFLGAAEREVVRASRNGATAVSRSGAMLDLVFRTGRAAARPDRCPQRDSRNTPLPPTERWKRCGRSGEKS